MVCGVAHLLPALLVKKNELESEAVEQKIAGPQNTGTHKYFGSFALGHVAMLLKRK